MNLKKVIFKGMAATALLVFVTPTFASAVDPTEVLGSESGKGATSHGHITITPADETTGPTDPIVPSEPDGETGNTGALTIDNVSPLEFNTHQLSGGAVEYSTTTKNPNVQITDIRGTGAGWTLQVSTSPFKDQTDETKILKGASVTLPIGTAVTTPGNVSPAPELRAVQLGTDSAVTTPQILMTAEKLKGMGTWVDQFEPSSLKIIVPAGNLAGEYVSTLTWSLLDAPQ
ncbi:WxL domain-containing protein [Peribacillus sp. NPDC076916]|uniref:WxL domain-containing protein n=1 Tax=Peribacillus sp. NPDC076916 TaxID=3390608 RepID=UPI003CFFF2F1